VWAVVAAMPGALRLAPMGGVLGFDVSTLVLVAEAQGVDRASLLFFLPWIESGMLEAVAEEPAREGA
jgi:hypothetical protein